MTPWELLGAVGLVSGAFCSLVGLALLVAEVARWRRELHGGRRLVEMREHALRQEREAVRAVSRPHGRRVVGLSCERRPTVTRDRGEDGG